MDSIHKIQNVGNLHVKLKHSAGQKRSADAVHL